MGKEMKDTELCLVDPEPQGSSDSPTESRQDPKSLEDLDFFSFVMRSGKGT